MRYRSLWLTAVAIEGTLVVSGLLLEKATISLSTGIVWDLTQMPSYLVVSRVLESYSGPHDSLYFFGDLFVMQSIVFGLVLSLGKCVIDAFTRLPPKGI